jgi:hypothetical protein
MGNHYDSLCTCITENLPCVLCYGEEAVFCAGYFPVRPQDCKLLIGPIVPVGCTRDHDKYRIALVQ